jgi:dimethylhistidine N-methyltransferase
MREPTAVRSPIGGRVTVAVHLDPADWSDHLAAETRAGLLDDPPWIPPVWFYDEVGSQLFDEITRLEEYYPTEAERRVLAAHADEMAAITAADTLMELGSGTSDKTMLLIDALDRAGTLRRLVPFDVSEEVLVRSSRHLAARLPGVEVHAVVGDFHRHLGELPDGGTRLLAFLGSTIGNLDPDQRAAFLAAARGALGDDDWFLLGTDLVKDPARLVAAYDDAAGVTARFNRNALVVLNRELGADFDPDAYDHRAHWDPDLQRIEMHLVARNDQHVTVPGLDGLEVRFAAGRHLRTEISTKFTPTGVAAELAAAGFAVSHSWSDLAGDVLVTLARPS